MIADSLLDVHVSDQQDTLQMQLTTEVDKYLQEVAVKREIDINYFDAQHVATNTINHQQIVDSAELGTDDIQELLDNNTSKKTEKNMEQYIRYKDELEMIPEESDEDLPVTMQGNSNDRDTILYVKGAQKMSSLIQLLMTPLMTQ